MKQQLNILLVTNFVFFGDVVMNFKYDEEGKKTDVKMVLCYTYSKNVQKSF